MEVAISRSPGSSTRSTSSAGADSPIRPQSAVIALTNWSGSEKGAMSMAMLDAGAKPAYFDEHSIGEQRFYNITCIVYGSAPQQYGALVERGVLPERRAARCMKEYTQKNKAWEDLLRPHIRK